MLASSGLNHNAITGEPLVIRFTHRSWTGKVLSGMPRAAVKNVAATLPIFDDIKYLMKAYILLQIDRPCSMILMMVAKLSSARIMSDAS